jgi:hypothetical protein
LVVLVVVVVLQLATESHAASGIEVMRLEDFPKHKVALHMPCEESNMFATKCMCHIKCTEPSCTEAKKLCVKYETSKGCKYVLIRNNGKLATLKREPLPEESARFDISMYPNTTRDLLEGSTAFSPVNPSWRAKWTDIEAANKLKNRQGPIIYQLLSDMEERGTSLVDKLFQPKTTSNQYCGNKYVNANTQAANVTRAKETFLSRGIALVALSYQAPMTLVNSMRSWKQSGLLDFMHETNAILNDPTPQEYAMSVEHGFQVIQPKDVKGGKTSKPNVFTIGAAFYYALTSIESEYLIFLENDFKMDTALSRKEVKAQLVAAAGMLDSGIEVVRLGSRKSKGCGTWKDCDHHGIHLKSKEPNERLRNWYAFYCREERKDAAGHVSDCFAEPDFRCFTSEDTNWTLNAVMVKKSTMLNKKYNAKGQMLSLGDIGLRQFQKQDGFESIMAWGLPWQQWKVPICIAYDGLFIHEEIETST